MQDQPTAWRVRDPGVRALFEQESQWQAWLDVEAALALAEAELGMIPAGAAAEIASKAQLSLLNRERIDEGLGRTGHPLVPMIWELDRICEGDAGGYVHWGATTQNITETGLVLLLRRAHAIFLGQLAAEVRALAPLALEAMQTEHEADRTTSVMMSHAVERACSLTGDILERLSVLIEGLAVFPERMRRNLELSGGTIMAEAVMLELGERMGRQRAHDVVYEAAQAAATDGGSFRELLEADPAVREQLTPTQLESLLDAERYTGLCRQLAEEQAEAARSTAAAIKEWLGQRAAREAGG